MTIIAFVGPDGAGKSTIITSLAAELKSRGISMALFHFRPNTSEQRTPVTEPYARKSHPYILSLAKVSFWMLHYLLWKCIMFLFKIPRIVIFDRFILDFQADPRRYRVHDSVAKRPWHRFKALRPDRTFIVLAETEIISLRKSEVTIEETAQQINNYLAFSKRFPGSVVLSGSEPIDVNVSKVMKELGFEG